MDMPHTTYPVIGKTTGPHQIHPKEPMIWTVSGSMSPLNPVGPGPHSGVDGFEMYILLPNGNKYKINNRELEQYKV